MVSNLPDISFYPNENMVNGVLITEVVRNVHDESEDSFILQLKRRISEQFANQMDEKKMTQILQEKKCSMLG